MSLDTSKLNLQGVGALSSNALMVSGVNPSSRFNVSIKADDNNHEFASSTAVLENVTNISGTSTFKITGNPGHQVNASMFINTNESTYYSSIDFSNTINNLDPLNEVLVTVSWITQNITSDVDIVLRNLLLQSIPDGNIYHKLSVNIVNPFFIDYELISVDSAFNINSNNSFIGHLEAGSSKNIGRVKLNIKSEYIWNKAFSDEPSIILNINSGLDLENYTIEVVDRTFTTLTVDIIVHPSLEHQNYLHMPDSIEIEAILDTPSISVDPDTYIEVPFTSPDGTGTQTFQPTIVTYLCNLVAIRAHEADGSGNLYPPFDNANWLTFPNQAINPDVLTFNVFENSTLVDRFAKILLYNTSDTSLPPAEELFIHQGEEDILLVNFDDSNIIFNNSGTNGNVASDGISISNITRSGGTIVYKATINPHIPWPTTYSEVLDFIIFSSNTNPNVSTLVDPSWLENNMSISWSGTSTIFIYFDIPAQLAGSPARSAEITIKRPGSSISKTFVLSQNKGFDVNTDAPNIYLAEYLSNSWNQIFNDGLLEVTNESSLWNFGIEMSANDILDNVSYDDLTIEVTGGYGDEPQHTLFAAIPNSPTNENPSHGSFNLYISNNTFDVMPVAFTAPAFWELKIYHPDLTTGPVFRHIIKQSKNPYAVWTTDFIQTTNVGIVEANFQAFSLTPGSEPVVALAGIKQYSYDSDDSQPPFTNISIENGGENVSHDLTNAKLGFHSDGISSTPIISLGFDDNGSCQFQIEDDFGFVDNPNNVDYRLYFYKIYPHGTNLDGFAPLSPTDGIREYPPDFENDPSILTIRQDIVVSDTFIHGVGLIYGRNAGFIIEEGLQNPLVASNSFYPQIYVPNNYYSSGLYQNYNGINVYGNDYDSSTQLLPLDGSATVQVDLSKQTTFLPGIDTTAGYNHYSRSLIVGLEIPNLGSNVSVDVFKGSVAAPTIYAKVDLVNGTVKDIVSTGAGVPYSDNDPTHNISFPSVQFVSDQIVDGNYPNYYAKYIKVEGLQPIPENFEETGQASLAIEKVTYYYRMTIDGIDYNFELIKPYEFYISDNEDFAVFLLCGERNMIGFQTPLATYPDETYEYKSTTYIADAAANVPLSAVHEVGNSPLDHQAGETGNTSGVAYQFVKKLRDEGYYAGRRILLIPAAYLDQGFEDSGSKDEWRSNRQDDGCLTDNGTAYRHAVGAANKVLDKFEDATLEGIIWIGGETDSTNNKYAIEFFNTIQQMRHDLGLNNYHQRVTQKTPFYVAGPVKGSFTGNKYTTWIETIHETVLRSNFYRLGVVNEQPGDSVNYDQTNNVDAALSLFERFEHLSSVTGDKYPTIDQFAWVYRQWFFGLDNQFFYNSHCETHFRMQKQFPGGNAPAYGVIYNDFDLSNSNSWTGTNRSRFSTLIMNNKPGKGLKTRVPEMQAMVFTIVFRYPASVTGKVTPICGNLESHTQDWGFEIFIDASGNVMLRCKAHSNFPNNSNQIDLHQIQSAATMVSKQGLFYFMTVKFRHQSIDVYDNVYTFGGPPGIAAVPVDTNMNLHRVSTYSGQIFGYENLDNREIILGNKGAWLESDIQPVEIAYFSYQEGASGNNPYLKHYESIKDDLMSRTVYI